MFYLTTSLACLKKKVIYLETREKENVCRVSRGTSQSEKDKKMLSFFSDFYFFCVCVTLKKKRR